MERRDWKNAAFIFAIKERVTDFWERLKGVIKDKDLTQEWIAAKTRLVGAFKNWIATRTCPNARQIVKIGRLVSLHAVSCMFAKEI